MLTINEQIEKINNDVAQEICWAESYEECNEIIEKGKQRIKALTDKNDSETASHQIILEDECVIDESLW
jgi:hypothetical protein